MKKTNTSTLNSGNTSHRSSSAEQKQPEDIEVENIDKVEGIGIK